MTAASNDRDRTVRRLSGRQITGIALVACLSVGLAPAAAVTASKVVIKDGHSGAVAKVTKKGALAVSAHDAVTGAAQRVDRQGRASVGDGGGSLTVDGSVGSSAPASAWHGQAELTANGGSDDVLGPVAGDVEVTSISLATFAGQHKIELFGRLVDASVTTGCTVHGGVDTSLWRGVATTGTTSITFPTPIALRHGTDTKACLYVQGTFATQVQTILVDATGYQD